MAGNSARPEPYTSAVNAAPVLSEVARAINEGALEAVLIGNAAAALQGAPVTTVDFDFRSDEHRAMSRN
jgi:hypothetical protein